ncbi:MAG: GGDEF domain-containing protein, partial [Planctomycetales bacterium]|nr:GGDEF domain-containing protein [Planctomycetales bacterium]
MIELLCTLAGIIAGVAVVASLMSQAGERQHFQAENEDEHSDKILGIADQLQVISHRVAADVSAHSEKVVHFSDRLNDSTEESDRPTHILSTINDIVSANREMQEQLADAQERIARQSRMIEQASKQARTDVLTGLANRRALDEYLSNCLSSQNENEVAGLLLMDIDHFKSFNDSFGHTTGDAVLASFARSISNCCGDQCYAARFGGEEFAVVLQARDAQDLARQAATVRFYVSEQVINYEDLQLKITASGGLARMVADEPISAIYERADEGLYQSKKAGRNRGFW